MCDTSMDSRNLHQQHHHQVHENQHVDESSINSSSSASLPSSCFSAADNDHAWRTPSFFLNSGNIHATCSDEAASNSLNNTIIGVQEMGFPWPNEISLNQSTSHHQDHHHRQLIADKIKDEPSPSTPSDHDHHHDNNPKCFAKFSDMLSSSTSPSDDMLLLKNTLSTSYKSHMLSNTRELHHQFSPFQPSMQYHHQNANMGLSTTFSQIFPSVNISNMSNNDNSSLSSPMSSSSSTIDHHMANNMQGGFDLFATARLLSGETSLNNSSAPSNNLLELFKGSPNQFKVDHDLQQSNELKRCNNNIANNVSSFNNNGGPSESSKNYVMEHKSTSQMTTKKQRFESRSSCPPFKVRKEKLGDRIAALQQLVSPFGKTDTASVLMEAIGYIKFLQNQVETLSVPYMKLASRSKSSNSRRVLDDEYNSDSGELNITDLKSRGLCLVPTSCMSYINLAAANNDPINGGVWPPPNFNPGGGF